MWNEMLSNYLIKIWSESCWFFPDSPASVRDYINLRHCEVWTENLRFQRIFRIWKKWTVFGEDEISGNFEKSPGKLMNIIKISYWECQ